MGAENPHPGIFSRVITATCKDITSSDRRNNLDFVENSQNSSSLKAFTVVEASQVSIEHLWTAEIEAVTGILLSQHILPCLQVFFELVDGTERVKGQFSQDETLTATLQVS